MTLPRPDIEEKIHKQAFSPDKNLAKYKIEMKDDVTTRVAHMLCSPLVIIVCKLCMMQGVGHGIMGRRFPDGGLLRYRK